ncbi:MAG: RIP metalloprotease RseP, partial [Bryobacteraceae bacterium]
MVIVENILWVVVLIGIMIMIHELGHYWAARFFDVRVEAFSFGFGPRLFGFRRGETDFRVSLVLFGGYVKMAGEQLGDENTGDPRSFLAKPRWQRLIIAMAGPFMNIVLAVVVLAGLFMFQYPKQTPGRVAGIVGYVTPASAAHKAGVQVGDRIVSIDGVGDPSWEDILMKEVAGAGRDLAVMIERSGKRIPMVIRPILDERFGGVAGWAEELEIQIVSVQPGMDAERAGLKRGDVLVSVNGKRAGSVHAVIEIIKNSGGAPVEIVYLRDDKENRVHVQPALAKDRGQERYMIGVQMSPRVTFVRLPPDEAFRQSLRYNANNATLIYQFLQGIVERRMSPKQIEGPIR